VIGLEQFDFVPEDEGSTSDDKHFYLLFIFLGLIGSMFSILQFFSSPLTGAVSDCLGRRPVILMTAVCVSHWF